jgi:hypothetical protein
MTPFPSDDLQGWVALEPLKSSLLDLTFELAGKVPPLTVGGGFGLYLKREHLKRTGERTLLGPELWPRMRSTRDIDVFVRAEVVADPDRVRVLAEALDRLGYVAVEGAKFMQFRREIERPGQSLEVKIDLLVGPTGPYREKLHIAKPRVRPKRKGPSGSLRLHFHDTPEAVGIDEAPFLTTRLHGQRSTGEICETDVRLPQAFPYVLMKLFAFHDRKDDPDPGKDRGRHHALDLYGIIAMMTAPEFEFARESYAKYEEDEKVREARKFVREDFAGPESAGVLGLRGHDLYTAEMDVDNFLSVLHEVVPPAS